MTGSAQWCRHHLAAGALAPVPGARACRSVRVMSDAALTTSLRRRPSGVLVLTELAHALAFLPLLLLGFILQIGRAHV